MKQSFLTKNWYFLYFVLATFDIFAICFSLGLSHSNLNKYEQAIEYINKSLVLKTEIDDKIGMASSSNNLGIIFKGLKDFHD